MKFAWKYVKKHKKILVFALILATINQVFSLLDPQIFRLIVDDYATKAGEIPQEAFVSGIILLLGLSVGVALISRIAKNFQDYFVNSITQKTGTELYAKSVEHTFSLPYEVFEDRRSGEILQKLQKARTDTQAIIQSSINILFLSMIGIVFVIVYAVIVHWTIGLAYFLVIPIVGVSTYTISRKIKDTQKSIVSESANLAGSTTETIRNVELVKSLGLEKKEIERLNEVNQKILDLELKKIRQIRVLSFIQGTIVNGTRASIMLLMLWLILQGIISLGEFFSLLIYSFFIFSPLAEFGTVASQYQEAKASNEQLDEILSIEPKKKPENAVVLPALKEIEFKNVSFKYSSGFAESVKNASLSIKAGKTTAFAGSSGSGKTTMVKLLLGLYEPTKGKILFNGIDSKKIDFDSLRKRIGLVSQETQLFSGTIRENLLFVNPKATDDECLEVLMLSSVTSIMERGGKGLDTKIGEGGLKISGGERQRLAIARALLRKPDLIVFDEATSALDSITEKNITQTIKYIKASRPDLIMVMVAHRLSTIMHSDIIYVIEKGKIIEQGSHEKLLRKKGLYSAFWREQSASLETETEQVKKLKDLM